MESEIKDIQMELVKLAKDMALIKRILLPKEDEEGELSDWAKEELAKAREESEEYHTSLEKL